MFLPTGVNTGDCSSCSDGEILTASDNHSLAQDILVYYKRFTPDTSEGNNSGFWFCDNGTAGVTASSVTSDGFASIRQDHLWGLWPPFCPTQTGGLTARKNPGCCDTHCGCPSTSTVFSKMGPQFFTPPPPAAVETICSQFDADGTADNFNLTQFQVDAIEGLLSNKTYSNMITCPGTASPVVQKNFTALCEHDGYEWLQDIYDDSENATPAYKHYWWDNSTNSVKTGTGLYLLSQTLTCVYHKEKWWQACEKTPLTNTDPEADVTNWPCRVPEYWIYGCAGVPVFSWEITEMLDAGKITSAEYEWFFKSQYLNEPLGKDAIGLSLINKLETTTWASGAPAGVGILQTKDWAGYTKNDGTTVPDTERRVIRKDLASYSGATKTVVRDRFFKARPGGWTHACFAPPDGSCESGLLSPLDIRQKCPQIPRGTGCNTAGTSKCSYNDRQLQTGDIATAASGSCLSVSPHPQKITCVNGTGACCGLCEGGCTSCGEGVQTACGSGIVSCSKTTFRSSCNAITFQHSEYYHDQGPLPSGTAAGQSAAERCAFAGLGHLWVLNESCDSSDDTIPKTCRAHSCPPGPPDVGPVGPTNLYMPLSSISSYCGTITGAEACAGAMGIGEIEPGIYCPGTRNIKRVNNDVNDRSPGQATIPPVDSDGCGRHLCAEKDPLGACCVTETSTGTTTCRESLTEQQCDECGDVSGFTSVWKGSNSCCLGTDPCS